jgi:cytochrome c peroxidase
MIVTVRLIIGIFLAQFATYSVAFSQDDKLAMLIELYGLEPASCETNDVFLNPEITKVGELIFNTTVLSGARDTSCSTCHVDSLAMTDGLPLSVGVGGSGEGDVRSKSSGIIVPRNSFTLFGRANKHYPVFFWDGKITEEDGKIYSPIGEGYALGFNSPLAVAAVMPILARDEFLGTMSRFSTNEHLKAINSAYYSERMVAANQQISLILEKTDADAMALKSAVLAAGIDKLTLVEIGNGLASFIASKQAECVKSNWDQYLNGQIQALTLNQKKGAMTFFGKGRCASCHSGSAFSDFEFHSIAVPQGSLGTHIHGQDIGRASVTYNLEDRYKFRTPPLLHVSKTAPYAHNGEFKTIYDVVLYHINPLPYLFDNGWTAEREKFRFGNILATRSKKLGYISITTEKELAELIDFLTTL